MESETTVDGCSLPLSPPPVPSGVPDIDPLADANCLKCGYALRGLAEYRCPECGTPFDPSDYVDTFVPKWPKLLLWMLVASLAAVVFQTPQILRVISVCVGSYPASSRPMPGPILLYYILWCVNWAVAAVGYWIAVRGLRRCSDQGRQAAMAVFMVPAVLATLGAAAAVVWVVVVPGTAAGLEMWCIRTAVATVLGGLSPSLILTICLATGLRRVSLGRGSSPVPSTVKAVMFSERSDWLLLIRLFLITIALEIIAGVLDRPYYTGGGLDVLAGLACWATGIVCLVMARRAWRRPLTVRRSVCIASAFLLIVWALRLASYLVQWFGIPVFSWTDLATGVFSHAATLFPCLALLLFVFKGIDRGDIERVARLPRNRGHTST